MINPFESIRNYYLEEKKKGDIGHWGEYFLAQAFRMLGEEPEVSKSTVRKNVKEVTEEDQPVDVNGGMF